MMNENNENMNFAELDEEALELVTGGKDTYKIKVSEANVRTGPGKGFSVIAILKKGEKVVYKGEKKKDKDGKNWLYIGNGHLTGWIRSDLMK